MDLRPLSDTHAVAPMIEPDDLATLAAEGYTAIICNRPDAEVPPSHQAAAMQTAAEAAGLAFTYNPITMPSLTLDAVEEQADALDGKTLAYCASGTRSAILWALAQAGKMPADAILAATAQAGYQLDTLRPQIEQLEKQA
ncbi:MAG: TIGR01244 family sulfur transferase [Pseudomonadota bacterium]